MSTCVNVDMSEMSPDEVSELLDRCILAGFRFGTNDREERNHYSTIMHLHFPYLNISDIERDKSNASKEEARVGSTVSKQGFINYLNDLMEFQYEKRT